MQQKSVYQINARNVGETLQFIKHSTFPGVLTGKNWVGVGTIFEAQ